MKIYICNAFSLGMLDRETQRHAATQRRPYPVDDPVQYLRHWEAEGMDILSVVGHANTAAIFSDALGMKIATNRETISLTEGDFALVGQYMGPRLEEGATTLPEGARIEWWYI